MPYGGNPSGDASDAVRLLVGDISTSTGGELLTDTDYDYFISVSPNVFSAACLALNSLAARISSIASSTSTLESKKVGDLALSFGVSAKNVGGLTSALRDLCKRLQLQSALQGTGAPYAGGISRADKQSVQNDSDRVRPSFFREMFDDPEARDPNSAIQEDST